MTGPMVQVLRAGRKFEVPGSNKMGEGIASTPVVASRRIYLGAFEALHAIETRERTTSAGGGK